MRKYSLWIAALIIAICSSALFAQVVPAKQPRLLLLVVIDQFRYDRFARSLKHVALCVFNKRANFWSRESVDTLNATRHSELKLLVELHTPGRLSLHGTSER